MSWNDCRKILFDTLKMKQCSMSDDGKSSSSLFFDRLRARNEARARAMLKERHRLLKRMRAFQVATQFIKMAGKQDRDNIWSDIIIGKGKGKGIEGSEIWEDLEWYVPELHGWPVKTADKDILNFLMSESEAPVRFLYLCAGEWRDFPRVALPELRRLFAARKACSRMHLRTHGKPLYLVNFVHMMLMSLRTGSLCSIAWIDKHGRCFFPSQSFEGDAVHFLSQLHERINHGGVGKRNFGGQEICPNVRTSVAEDRYFASLGSKLVNLEPQGTEFSAVKIKFLDGMGTISSQTTVVNIYRILNDKARFREFNSEKESIVGKRVDAHLRFAWHGTSKQGAAEIVRHGFQQISCSAAAPNGRIYLTAVNQSRSSAMFSEVDNEGIQHMILCQVIAGSMELPSCSNPGSEQDPPASTSINGTDIYDPDIDHLSTPLPLYIVSFKVST